jgi:hypothetical protein
MGYLWKTLKKCGKINLFMGYEWYIDGLLMININAMMEYQWHYDLTLLGLLSRFFVISPMGNDLENAHHVVQFLVHLGSADPKKSSSWRSKIGYPLVI